MYYHKLRSGNGRPPITVVSNGRGVWTAPGKRIALFRDNSPTIGWVTCLASKRSLVAEHLVQTLALRLKTQRACPLMPIHIKEKCNAISDVPSRSFGSNPAWKCNTDADLLTLFNPKFPLPH
jgi:hypothetical protein